MGLPHDGEDELRVELSEAIDGRDDRFDVLAPIGGCDCEHVRGPQIRALAVGTEAWVNSRPGEADPVERDPEPLVHVRSGEAGVDEDEVTRARGVSVLAAVHAVRPPSHVVREAKRVEVVDGRDAEAASLWRIHPVGEVENVDRPEKALDVRAAETAPRSAPGMSERDPKESKLQRHRAERVLHVPVAREPGGAEAHDRVPAVGHESGEHPEQVVPDPAARMGKRCHVNGDSHGRTDVLDAGHPPLTINGREWSSQHDEILVGRPLRTCGREFEEVEADCELVTHVFVRMEDGAEIATGRLWPTNDELPGLVRVPLLARKTCEVPVSVGGQHEHPARHERPSELREPGVLVWFREVCEDGDRVDRAKPLVWIRKWWFGCVSDEGCNREVLVAPLNGVSVSFAAVQFDRIEPVPVPDDAPTAATEVEQTSTKVELDAGTREGGADRFRGQATALDEPTRTRGSSHTYAEARRRDRQTVGGSTA